MPAAADTERAPWGGDENTLALDTARKVDNSEPDRPAGRGDHYPAQPLPRLWLEPAYVFTAWDGRGAARASARPLTPSAAWQIITGYARACGLAHVKPHDFRRFVGTRLAARDIRQAQRALGHKRIDTTARHYVLDELAPGLTEGLY